MSVKTFEELYVDSLRDLYSAERQLVAALPKVAKAVSTPELSKAIEDHLRQTEGQVARLVTIFEDLGEKPTGHVCKAMEGLIEEGKEIMDEVERGPLCDAALIGAAQKIEHYEIAGYGTARTFAEMLGRKSDRKLLQATLDEETRADQKLSEIAEGQVNDRANRAGEAGKADRESMAGSNSRS